MIVHIEEEYGFRNHHWHYPGTIDELVADWLAGRAPFYRPILATMPPRFDENAPHPHYRGDFEADACECEATVLNAAEARLYVDCDRPCLLLQDGRNIALATEPPTIDELKAGIINPLVRTCITEEALKTILDQGPAPYTHNWLMAHFTICPKCEAMYSRLRPGSPLEQWPEY